MKVADIMTSSVEMIHPELTIMEAAKKMKGLNIGIIPVAEKDRIIGTLTDRDVVVNTIAEGRDPMIAKVRDAMHVGVLHCYESDDVEKAAHIMKEKKIRRLLVLNDDDKLVGILSLADLAFTGQEKKLAGDVLEAISEPR